MFFCKFCEISKNSFFIEHIQVTASELENISRENFHYVFTDLSNVEVPFIKNVVIFSKMFLIWTSSKRLTVSLKIKLVFLHISFEHRKTPVLESLFRKVAGLKACKFIKKKAATQVFSREHCEIFKNIYFEEDLRMAASNCPTCLSKNNTFSLKQEM